jgi:large subunit ribosomal protein L29
MAKGTVGPLKMTELKELTLVELTNRMKDWQDQLEVLKFQLDSGQLPNQVRVRTVRRDIARLRTLIREYELGLRKPKGANA